MGKTYRHGDLVKPYRNGNRQSVDYTRRSEQPKVITPEWAVDRMADHVNFELEKLISEDHIAAGEKWDFQEKINDRIRAAVPEYTSAVSQKTGRSSSAAHFFTVVVDHAVADIRKASKRLKARATFVPIVPYCKPEDEKAGKSISEESLSDECRSVKELEFRMDVNTLTSMMDELEREIFQLRLQEYTQEEIAAKLMISRFKIMRIMKSIRAKARKCGFIPRSEVEGRRRK